MFTQPSSNYGTGTGTSSWPCPPPVAFTEKRRTYVLVILDESGSMISKKDATLSALNGFLEDQARVDDDECFLSLVTFNYTSRFLRHLAPIRNVQRLSDYHYHPGGGTALYDAFQEGVQSLHSQIRPGDRVVCVILTDGEENSSKRTTLDTAKALIKYHEGQGNWTFVYLGANPNAWTFGQALGLSHGNIAQYADTAFGTSNAIKNVSHATTVYRGSNMMASANYLTDVQDNIKSGTVN